MRRIWHRHAWLQPLFSLLARFDILFPESGCDVPASMTVAKVDEGATWRRTFAFVKSRRFEATMRYLPQSVWWSELVHVASSRFPGAFVCWPATP